MGDGEYSIVNVVELDESVVSLARVIEDVPQYICFPGHPGRISRVPQNLREIDVEAYEPNFLSIGPYHHGMARVQQMEKRKHMFLKCVLEQKPEVTLKDYLQEIRSTEPAARSFYSEVEMESEKFVRMLLLDSLFILSLFCGMPESRERENQETTRMASGVNEDLTEEGNRLNENSGIGESVNTHDSQNTPRWFWSLFAHDLFLLENQIPFFVIQKMHILAYGVSETPIILTMKNTFSRMLSNYTNSEVVISETGEIHHLLHLCHHFFRPTLQQSGTWQLPESCRVFRLGNAVQLYESGVSFQAISSSAQHSLLDITFDSAGKMVMPCLQVDDNTVSLLRNLIALEQMKYPSLGLNVSAYAVLLLHLITIPKDVELLRKKGIIHHHLSSDKEMVYLVNRLSMGLAFDYFEDDYSLKPVFQGLKRYTEHRLPHWRAWIKHKYFNNPWTIISLLAASFLLLLSAIQTYYAVYSFYRPPSSGF